MLHLNKCKFKLLFVHTMQYNKLSLDNKEHIMICGKKKAHFKNVVIKTLGQKSVDGFSLPEQNCDNVKHIIPISGGADSSCTAVVLMSLFPDVDFTLVFTDTGDESDALYGRLDELEAVFGKPIIRLTNNGETLYSLIEKYNGFLPSSRSRYCTSSLKIKPFDNWMKEQFSSGESIYNYVGIRADEDRFGMASNSDSVHTVFPLTKLNADKAKVFSILEQTIGLPSDYKDKSRSGCQSCFYQANHELLRYFVTSPKKFAKAASYEKFNESDTLRFKRLKDAFADHYESAYNALNPDFANYPIPSFVDGSSQSIHKASSLPEPAVVSEDSASSLFSENRPVHNEAYTSLFVAVAFLVDPLLAAFGKDSTTGVYNQRLITFSKSFTGLKQSMSYYWQHRLNTAQAWGESEDDIKSNLKIAIYRLELPAQLVDLNKTSKGSFSWKTDITYSQLEHHFKIAHTLLTKGGYEQMMSELLEQEPDADKIATYKALAKKRKTLKSIPGYISWAGLWSPPKSLANADSALDLAPVQNDLFGSAGSKKKARKYDAEDSNLICVTCTL